MHYSEAGLTKKEYDALTEALGRQPNDCELLIMGVMWSEHCCYKSTKPLLSLFPTKGENVVLGPGENAGIVDIGDNEGIAFKVESHNHPSAVAPYQGSATGVGGIIRDIIALGARPIASMDGLFFGDPELQKTKNLSDGIVKGIGGYGNSVGVPTVGGKTVYDKSYGDNPLVNALCLGYVKLDGIISSQTAKPGQAVVLLGSKTGRDGIAGAAFASVELSDDTKSSRPNIQIGDPFVEKLLIEACIELRDKGLIVSMQDMGAAGITSSSSEIAAKSGVGMIMHFDKVPLRETGMEPWEIALSESQERMLIIAEYDRLDEISDIARKWDLDAVVIGEVIEGNDYRIMDGDTVVADLPASLIGSDCPFPDWDNAAPEDLAERQTFRVEDIEPKKDLTDEIRDLLSSPNLRDKRWIFEQYDQMVQLNTVIGPGNNDVSMLRIKGSDKLVAVSMEADPWKCYLNPYRGGAEAVARSVRALAVSGAKVLGMTDCLNYPSPEAADQYWELSESVKGMAECCSELECPVVSGNVSLYNETSSERILPTPLVGVVGLIKKREEMLSCGNWKEGDIIFYVGLSNPSLAGSQYQLGKMGCVKGLPLPFNGEAEKDFVQRALKTAKAGLASSGRSIAGGGLGITLAKECIASDIGARLEATVPTRKDIFLFGEGGPRAVYAVPAEHVVEFKYIWEGYPLMMLGKAGGNDLVIDGYINIPVAELKQIWRNE